MPEINSIKEMAQAGQSVAGISRELAIDEKTVRKYLKQEDFSPRPPEEVVQRGSGWGALERQRRQHAGDPPFCDGALIFDDAALGAAQTPWLQLLRAGALPRRAPAESPGAWMVQPEWRDLLERSVTRNAGDHWLAWLHLGVMRLYANDVAGARAAWDRSLRQERSAWALRNLALLEYRARQAGPAADLWMEAQRLAPELYPLAVECGSALLRAGRADSCLDMVARLSPALRTAGRIRHLEAQARLDRGEIAAAEQILLDGLVVVDLQEGESSLTDLWFGVQERRLSEQERVPVDEALRKRVRREFPPPAHLEFRGQANGTA